ncbi:hypothetical protein P9112_000781 [Eukaryota sp. TZLM1-RC]
MNPEDLSSPPICLNTHTLIGTIRLENNTDASSLAFVPTTLSFANLHPLLAIGDEGGNAFFTKLDDFILPTGPLPIDQHQTSLVDNNSGYDAALHDRYIYQLRFSHHDASFLTCSADQSAVVWDTETNTRITVLEGHTACVKAACFIPESPSIIATASRDGGICIWDTRSASSPTLSPARTLSPSSPPRSPPISQLRAQSPPTVAKRLTADRQTDIVALDHNYIASSTNNGAVNVWDARTCLQSGRRHKSRRSSSNKHSLHIPHLSAASKSSPASYFSSADDIEPVHTFSLPGAVSSLSCIPRTGRLLATVARRGIFSIDTLTPHSSTSPLLSLPTNMNSMTVTSHHVSNSFMASTLHESSVTSYIYNQNNTFSCPLQLNLDSLPSSIATPSWCSSLLAVALDEGVVDIFRITGGPPPSPSPPPSPFVSTSPWSRSGESLLFPGQLSPVEAEDPVVVVDSSPEIEQRPRHYRQSSLLDFLSPASP